MTLIERLRQPVLHYATCHEAADLLESQAAILEERDDMILSQAARIAELEAELAISIRNESAIRLLMECYQLGGCTDHERLACDLTAIRRKIDEAPVVAWLCEGKDIYGEYYCYVVSATPPDQDHVTIKPLISKEDLA